MKFQLGTYRSPKPRVRVFGGYDPQNARSSHRKLRLPVAEGETIYSGMVISPVWNASATQYEWRAGWDGAASIYDICIADGDSLHEDIISAGVLPGLKCSGSFDIQTGFYAPIIGSTAETYNAGVYLTPCLDSDTGTGYPAGSLKGYLRTTTAQSGEPVVGTCHGTLRGPYDIGQGVADGSPNPPTTYGAPGQESGAIDTQVIRFDTNILPNLEDETE